MAPAAVRRKRDEPQGERSDTGGENTDADIDYWPEPEVSTLQENKENDIF